jgi:hypothetical protein
MENTPMNFQPNPERIMILNHLTGHDRSGKKPSHVTVPLSILTAALLVGPVATVGDTVADVLLGYAVLTHPAVEVSLRTVRAVQLICTAKHVYIFVFKLCLLKGMKSSIMQLLSEDTCCFIFLLF